MKAIKYSREKKTNLNLKVDDIAPGDLTLLVKSTAIDVAVALAYVVSIARENDPGKHVKRSGVVFVEDRMINVKFWTRFLNDLTARTYVYFQGASTGFLIANILKLPEREVS